MSESALYKGVVMLNHPPIDKPAALYLLRRALGTKVPIVRFWYDKLCSVEQMLLWEAKEDLFPIDIGPDKYHQTSSGSASARITDMFGLVSPGERKLVEILNRNNKTGDLKGMFMSIAWTMRELYELPGFDQVDIIERVCHVVEIFVRTTDGESDASRTQAGMEEALRDLVEQTKKCNFGPFTPGRYLRDLWTLGVSPEEIKERVAYWVDGWNLARRLLNEARELYGSLLNKSAMTFNVGLLTGIKLATGSRLLAKAAGYDKTVDIRIIKDPDSGLATVVGRKHINMAPLAALLQRKEPGLWYYHEAAQALINGGVQYTETPPTKYNLDELQGLVQQCI